MKSRNKLIIFSFLATFICSCDPSSDYRQVIENKSSSDIWIVAYEKVGGIHIPNDSVLAKANSQTTFFSASSTATGGYWTNKDCSYPLNIDSLGTKVVSPAGFKLTFDINDKSRWRFSEGGNSAKGLRMQCKLTIGQGDVVAL